MKREMQGLMLGVIGLLGAGWLMNRILLPRKQQRQCEINLKQIGLAMMQYSRDYDEKLPPRSKWQTVFIPYHSGHQDPPQPPLECPSGWYYAMNGHLAGKSLGVINSPQSLAFAWDAQTTQRNTMDNGRLWPVPLRHPDGNNVLFMDGHVAAVKRRPRSVVVVNTTTPSIPTVVLLRTVKRVR